MKRTQLHSRPSPSAGLCTIAEEADIDYAFLRLQKYVHISCVIGSIIVIKLTLISTVAG